ncbi:hypothetical protein GIB67_000123 [Kingdonia uniflora]|uniref:Uncharacterized protein n=1 Tax=Kingdonia uniflora TaxID=39325 RepID=A0A7J7M5T4_9MAGN|nr:hypothetical protein GIB67_000123 [Kingdonia uniflora]
MKLRNPKLPQNYTPPRNRPLSDTNCRVASSKDKIPSRFSSFLNLVCNLNEYITLLKSNAASKWGLPFIEPYFKNIGPSYRHGINFAVAGATVINITEEVPIFFPLQTDQFDRFKRRVYASLRSKTNQVIPY